MTSVDENQVELSITRCDGSTVIVRGVVTTLAEMLALLEDGLRGAGFHVPYQSLVVDDDAH